ncbi:hypothetical protein DV736_g1367, partial [Chaetothyriales sp. CBS 134916]
MGHKRNKSDTTPVVPVEEKEGIGAFALVFGLPVLTLASVFLCNDVSGCPAPALLDPGTLTLAKLKEQTAWPENGLAGLFDAEALAWTLAYYGLSLALQLLLPGVEREGTVLGTGGRHEYKFNSFGSALIILAGLGAGTSVYGADFVVWRYIWDKFAQIAAANLVIATVLAVWTYVRSFTVPGPGQVNPEHRELVKGADTGNVIYDFFMGRELNPRVTLPDWLPLVGRQVIDIKVFMEMRPGLLGWVILDLAFVARQYRAYGRVSDSIILVTGFQALYVFDSLYMEPAILTMRDITIDGFGFMLSFGDVAWLPFIYSLQARYLASYPVHLGVGGIAAVLAIQALGLYIFRASNNEKNWFRTNPKDPRVAHLRSMQTAAGTRLITSGWWGRARHINYLGDWIMSFSYSLPTGIAGFIQHRQQNAVTGSVTLAPEQGAARGWGMIFTYFYVLYFGVLLVHRELRDEEKCRRKYGKDWDAYCEVVRWKIIPGNKKSGRSQVNVNRYRPPPAMPTVLRNGRALPSQAHSSVTASSPPTTAAATRPQLPGPTGLLLLLYPVILILGSLFSVLSPVAAPTSTVSAPPEADHRSLLHHINYFAAKRNVFNLYFVKVGWFWTTLAFAALLLTARPQPASKSRLYAQALLRYTIVTLSWILTTQWLFGPPLIDRSFTITGGQCEAPTTTTSVFSSAACKAAGGRWHGGHDVSGHIFMLTLASAFLLYELYVADSHSAHASVSPAVAAKVAPDLSGDDHGDERRARAGWETQTAARLRIYARYLVWAVAGLAFWMFMMTAIWFHTWQEKLSGLLLAEATIWTVYFLPNWVPALKSVVGGFD